MSSSSSTRWYAALATLVIFVLLAWLLGAVLALTDGERVAIRVGLVALGLVAAAALLWYLRPQDEVAAAPRDSSGADVIAAVSAARARLPRGGFDAKALVLVTGATGGCKTSVVTQSGTDPELLAGDGKIHGTDAAAATVATNLWLVKDAILAEPGSAVFADEALWKRFVRAVRPPRLAAAFGRGTSSPRSAVVCVPCDMFFGTDARGQLDALAQLTRARLTQAAREFGVALPVYVVFTKADKVPNFESWVTPFTHDEVRAPLGIALPLDESAAGGKEAVRASGTYAERIVPRLEAAFASIVSSLSRRRLDLLGRESQPEKRLQAYELPREMGKLATEATRFLVEICRPVHIGVSPQLRGFYFVGARPVVVSDTAPAPAAAQARASSPGGGSADATSVFSSIAQQAPASVAEQPARGASRRVPQWVFLPRLFPEVFFSDKGAQSLTRGGLRVSSVRRVLLGTGIAASVVVSMAVARSWMGNRSLAQRTAAAARDVANLPEVPVAAGTPTFPSAEALGRLETLRTVLDTLHGYNTGQVPRRLTWGLWQGKTLLDAARRVWLEGYRRQLHTFAFTAVVDSLRALPASPRPTDEYPWDYNMLRAYLIMTAEPPKSTPELLAPVLLRSWRRGQEVDSVKTAIALRQFEFYASGLAQANPWPLAADTRLVNRTREFLNRFSGADPIYVNMMAKANKEMPPIRWSEAVPQAAGIIAAPPEVQGAFTAAGWTFMENAFENSEGYFGAEEWVVGDSTAGRGQDRDVIIAELRTRYRNEYAQQWRAFIRSTSVVRPSGVGRAAAPDAARRLVALGGPQSPLLAAFALVARNTDVDSLMRVAFQPVHSVVPPDATDKLVTDGNGPYVGGLSALASKLEEVSNLPQITDTASAQDVAQWGKDALGQVTQAKNGARSLAQKFRVDAAAMMVGPGVAALLEAPINGAEGVLRTIAATKPPTSRPVVAPPAGGGGGAPPPPPPSGGGGGDKQSAERKALLNERGERICQLMTPMLAKFPFNPDATNEATIAEVTGLLAPGTGQLAAFRQEGMADLLDEQGGQWVAKGGGPVVLSQPFVAFFNRAAKVSAALFGGGPTPRVVFHAQGIATPQTPNVTLKHGEQMQRFNQTSFEARVVWPPTSVRQAILIAQFGKEKEREIAKATGEWAIFRLVAQSAKTEDSGAEFTSEWSATGKGAVPVKMTFRFESGVPVMKRGWLGGMTCVSQVTR